MAGTSSNSKGNPAKPIPYTAGKTCLSDILPPLIFGTATFNYQYNNDPHSLNTTDLVYSALSQGLRAFDTSPYYGPSEILLGKALVSPEVQERFPRETYMILTKVGRIKADEFDYSAQWVRKSIEKSLERLGTDYLDLVYCHDVEFVSPAEVLEAVCELRRIRDEEKKIRFIGISGYPLEVLSDLAQLILKETGKPIDAVQSYANYTLQNQRLLSHGLHSLHAAGVAVIPNASLLGMGLLRRQGVPVGALGDWHPSTRGLREAVRKASDFCDQHGEKIETVALRWALETWIEKGSLCGTEADPDPAAKVKWAGVDSCGTQGSAMGVSVIGVSNVEELEDTMMVWRSILDGLEGGEQRVRETGRWKKEAEWSRLRGAEVRLLAEGVEDVLGEWFGYTWESPEKGWVNVRKNVEKEKITQ
ncbi:Aldo/keto reductase [Delitschia confertaspora ATCC 74209]|uniref:Aldo/keto reductase n=1 Tax=Delitschia confertaspora ATCC 74209 TaxID=1513339 RepID=A0A9P4JSA6_9PLEO|nr:Aldo/keto reductase [Delitschia confertaspora ATCC 74209]